MNSLAHMVFALVPGLTQISDVAVADCFAVGEVYAERIRAETDWHNAEFIGCVLPLAPETSVRPKPRILK